MNRLHELLDRTADEVPHKIALIAEGKKQTYAQFAAQTVVMAAMLQNKGIQSGDRVVLLLPSSPELLALVFAISRLGAIFVILNDTVTTYSLRNILDDAGSALVITDQELQKHHDVGGHLDVRYELVEDLAACASAYSLDAVVFHEVAFPSSSPACLIYTSGSTGKPKAIVSTHDNIRFSVQAIQACLQLESDDVIGSFLPFSFDYGLYQAFLSIQARATLAVGRREDIGPGLLSKLQQWGATVFPSMPHLTCAIVRLGHRVPKSFTLRVFTTTGARHPRTYSLQLLRLFPDCKIYSMYGLTECKRVSVLPPEYWETKAESVGLPLPGTECQVIDASNNILPARQIGQLVVAGPHVMQGYWRDPELTARTFGCFQGQRVLFTGDLFFKDEEGFLYYYGREDDLYKRNGFRISATELERAVGEVDGVLQAAVILQRGETERAILFYEGSLSSEQVRERLSMRLEMYKMPDEIFPLRQLPTTPNQKVDKSKLREMYEKGEASCILN